MRAILFTAIAIAAPAAAEVKSAAVDGFEVVSSATVAAPPAEVYAALGQPGRWWSPAHTYSGDARNMVIETRAGGCFCETVPVDGSTIEHGRVVYAQPGKVLRISGALGPLQEMGVSGALTWTLKPAAAGTEVTQRYVVGGYIPGGAEKLAPIVDQVLGEQLAGLAKAFQR